MLFIYSNRYPRVLEYKIAKGSGFNPVPSVLTRNESKRLLIPAIDDAIPIKDWFLWNPCAKELRLSMRIKFLVEQCCCNKS